MHIDDLDSDIPRARFRWMEMKVRVLIDVEDELLKPWKSVHQYFDAAYDIEMLSATNDGIGTCSRGHVITATEERGGECGWCEAEAEEWAERRYDR